MPNQWDGQIVLDNGGKGFAYFSTDANGNVTGLVGPDGLPITANGAIDVRGHGARVDGIALYDVMTTNSTTCAVSSATANFTSADVGKWAIVNPNLDSASNTSARGTITAVTDATHATISLNIAPGTLTNALLIYGTDDGSAFNSALAAAASTKKAVFVPGGIMLSKTTHIVPSGVHLFGVGHQSMGGGAASKDFRHNGSTIVCGAYSASTPFIILGDAGLSSPLGASMSNINVDAFNYAPQAVSGLGSRTNSVRNCTILRGATAAYISGPSGRTHNCSIIQANVGPCVEMSGDGQISMCKIMGAGNGHYAIKISNGDNISVVDNHIWKNAAQPTMLGGAVLVETTGSANKYGGVLIANNRFDTSFGPHIKLRALGTSQMRGVTLLGNIGMANDAVPDGTYPWMAVETDSGAQIRGLSVVANVGRGSWNDPTKGELTCFVDGSANAGHVYASAVLGNIMDNCGGGYISFTPDTSSGNFYLAGVGTTAVGF